MTSPLRTPNSALRYSVAQATLAWHTPSSSRAGRNLYRCDSYYSTACVQGGRNLHRCVDLCSKACVQGSRSCSTWAWVSGGAPKERPASRALTMPVFTQGPRAGPPVVEGALPCWARTVPDGPALQENCPVWPAAASLTIKKKDSKSCKLDNNAVVLKC